MPHAKDVLAAFQSGGETRLIFARPKTGGNLVMLPDGEARQWKELTKADLRCPIPDCSSPELRAVARHPRKRDGFTHLSGAGGHSDESYNHIDAKGQIARWLRDRYSGCTVTEEQPSNSHRERVADVMITNPAGDRIAFEIQYAAINPDDLARRSSSYAAQGIRVVWLFGHAGAQLKRSRRRDGSVTLTPTHEWMTRNGMPVYWFNPFTLEVAVATTSIFADGKQFEVAASDRDGALVVEPLDVFSLRQSGFGSDFTRTLTANRDEAGRRMEAARVREEARARQIEQVHLRREEKRLQTLERARAKWASSELCQRMLKHFDGVIPSWLEAPIGGKLPIVASEWQCMLYERLILGRFEDATVSLAECTDVLAAIVPVPRNIRESIAAAWLVEMARAGQITRIADCAWRASDDSRKFVTITRERAKQRNSERLVTPKNAAPPLPTRLAQTTTREAVVAAERPRSTPTNGTNHQKSREILRSPVARRPKCAVCGFPLDPVFAADGAHSICLRRGR